MSTGGGAAARAEARTSSTSRMNSGEKNSGMTSRSGVPPNAAARASRASFAARALKWDQASWTRIRARRGPSAAASAARSNFRAACLKRPWLKSLRASRSNDSEASCAAPATRKKRQNEHGKRHHRARDDGTPGNSSGSDGGATIQSDFRSGNDDADEVALPDFGLLPHRLVAGERDLDLVPSDRERFFEARGPGRLAVDPDLGARRVRADLEEAPRREVHAHDRGWHSRLHLEPLLLFPEVREVENRDVPAGLEGDADRGREAGVLLPADDKLCRLVRLEGDGDRRVGLLHLGSRRNRRRDGDRGLRVRRRGRSRRGGFRRRRGGGRRERRRRLGPRAFGQACAAQGDESRPPRRRPRRRGRERSSNPPRPSSAPGGVRRGRSRRFGAGPLRRRPWAAETGAPARRRVAASNRRRAARGPSTGSRLLSRCRRPGGSPSAS